MDTILVYWDANLPNINWGSHWHNINGYNYRKEINENLLQSINGAGLEQIVNFPMRGNNTLDISATNHQTLVTSCKPMRGISVHDFIIIQSEVYAKYQRATKHKIYLWKNANTEVIKKNRVITLTAHRK